MAFRVKTSTKAKRDLDAILAWLSWQGAGDAGLRWFQEMREAAASLAHSPHAAHWLPRTPCFPSSCASYSTDASRTCTASSTFIEGNTVSVLHVRHGRRRPLTKY